MPGTATRVSTERVIISGEPGTVWTNDTPFVQYQFVASLINTCGMCLQYHLQITRLWGIPLHRGCNCHQVLIRREAVAPHAFCDYRELLDRMPADQKVKCIGGACYRLLKEGLATWGDIVTPGRVRTLEQVVARNKLTIRQMVDAGVQPGIARRAYETVHTPEADLIEHQRKELFRAIQKSGIAQDVLVEELGKRLAARVVVAPPPSAPPTAPSPTPASPTPPPSSPPSYAPVVASVAPAAPAHVPASSRRDEMIPPRAATPPPAPIAVAPKVDPRELAKILADTKVTKGESGKAEVRVPPAPKPAPEPTPRAESQSVRAVDPGLREYKDHAAAVEARAARQTKVWAKLVHMDPQTYASEAAQKFAQVVDESEMYLRIEPASLRGVLRDGRFKSQFETGTSRGLLDRMTRRAVEAEVTGVTRQTPAHERPVYGYFGAKDHGGYRTRGERSVANYGSVSVRIKESARERASVTAGDSLSRRTAVQAQMANGASAPALGIGDFQWDLVHQAIFEDKASLEGVRAAINEALYYIEAQFHGGLDVDDIQDVVFGYYPSLAIREALAARRIPWRVIR
jgi:hypothetical protein